MNPQPIYSTPSNKTSPTRTTQNSADLNKTSHRAEKQNNLLVSMKPVAVETAKKQAG